MHMHTCACTHTDHKTVSIPKDSYVDTSSHKVTKRTEYLGENTPLDYSEENGVQLVPLVL